MALAKVETRAAVRLAGSWRDDRRDVRCKMEDVRGLTGVGSLLIEGTMSKNEEIAGFLRQRMVAEMKRFHEFADNMNGRAYYGGSIFVQFKDGTTDEYLLRPEDWQDVINFAQALCAKRTKECQDKLKDYE